MKHFLAIVLFVAVSLAQDTNYCPDGWFLAELDGKRECIYFGSQYEGVTKIDAEVLCSARGGHLVDMDEGRGPAKNNLVKSLLSDFVGQGDPGRPGPQWDDQWWIGWTSSIVHVNQVSSSGRAENF